ncbi:MAG: GNAT family N-acetyltransferase [Planctomycetota bacterium]|jgi:ribosomal protein S18 acetylase RimI-like enzyme|nr:GNAT family N-acetyltransferase [Planctomycetota bacterium]
MKIKIAEVDYSNPAQTRDLVQLLNEYASEPMGGGEPIDSKKHAAIVNGLASFPTAFSLIGYVDGAPAALANCFFGFSTFAAQKLVNIHDLMVSKEFRRTGLSQNLLEKIEEIARLNQCCKLTLEVLANNEIAKGSYRKYGFEGYELDPTAGEAVFWQKKLQ